jgi:hypothetical protein
MIAILFLFMALRHAASIAAANLPGSRRKRKYRLAGIAIAAR